VQGTVGEEALGGVSMRPAAVPPLTTTLNRHASKQQAGRQQKQQPAPHAEHTIGHPPTCQTSA
jgi:hypothetical protein